MPVYLFWNSTLGNPSQLNSRYSQRQHHPDSLIIWRHPISTIDTLVSHIHLVQSVYWKRVVSHYTINAAINIQVRASHIDGTLRQLHTFAATKDRFWSIRSSPRSSMQCAIVVAAELILDPMYFRPTFLPSTTRALHSQIPFVIADLLPSPVAVNVSTNDGTRGFARSRLHSYIYYGTICYRATRPRGCYLHYREDVYASIRQIKKVAAYKKSIKTLHSRLPDSYKLAERCST